MPFGFSFVTTSDDANRQYFERSKSALFRGLAEEKRVFNPKPLPGSFAPSSLLQCMLNVYESSETGVVVVYSESGLGKSVAARLVLSKASRGIMFAGKLPSHGIYWKHVAGLLGVPKERNYEDFYGWVNVLIEQTVRVPRQPLLRSCFAPDVPLELDLPVEFDVAMPRRPLLVFDDFDEVSQEDYNFMKVVFDLADTHDALVLVLTSDKPTANRLLKQNHWRRIRPLEGSYDDKRKRRIPDGTYDDPHWMQMNWTQAQLECLLRCHGFTDAEIFQVSAVDAENPYDVLRRAKRILRPLLR